MKRVMVAVMMLLVTGSVFATEVNVDREKGKIEVKKEVIDDQSELNKNDESCTVTVSGELSVGVAKVDVECSATAATCDRAIKKLSGCLKAAKRELLESLR